LVPTLLTTLEGAGINHEILIVDGGSADNTCDVLVFLQAADADADRCCELRLSGFDDDGDLYDPRCNLFE
jgi:hypothetical protein